MFIICATCLWLVMSLFEAVNKTEPHPNYRNSHVQPIGIPLFPSQTSATEIFVLLHHVAAAEPGPALDFILAKLGPLSWLADTLLDPVMGGIDNGLQVGFGTRVWARVQRGAIIMTRRPCMMFAELMLRCLLRYRPCHYYGTYAASESDLVGLSTSTQGCVGVSVSQVAFVKPPS